MTQAVVESPPLEPLEPPDLVIGLPRDFRDLPLAADPDEWSATAAHFLDLLPVERSPELTELALAHLRAYSDLLSTGGVVRACACLGLSGGELTTASILFSWQRSAPAAPADVVALGLRHALAEQHPERATYGIELPIGPAVAVLAERTIRGTDPSGAEVDIAVRSIEVSIPIDEQPWILVVALSSPSVADWDNYETIMGLACKSIRLALD